MGILLCNEGYSLCLTWSRLLDQKRPKAEKQAVSSAKRAYINHRRKCKRCQPWKEEGKGNEQS